MPFIPRDPRQYRPTNPGQEWLNQLRSGGRITASLPLLDATGSFTDRLKAPGWRERQAAGQRARSASGTYAEPQSRIPGAPTPGTIQASARPSATSSAASVISSLRPRGQGFIEEIAQGPPMTDRPPEQVYSNPLAPGGYSAMPSAAEWNAGAATTPVQDRTDVGDGGGGFFSDVGDGGGGFFSDVGGYLGGPGMGNALIRAGGGMMEAAGQPGATFGGSLGTGLKGFADERARFQTSEAARRQAAQEGQTSPQDLAAKQSVIQARLALRGIDDPIEVQRYMAMVVDQDGYEAALKELEAPEAPGPTDLEELKARFAWFDGLTPEQQASFNYMQRSPPSETTINTGDTLTPIAPAEEAMGEWVQNLYTMRQTIENQTLPGLENIEQTLAIVNHERFPEISGVLRGNVAADVAARVRGDPVLLGMIGAFERLGQERTLQILANFTGAKSNYELDMARKMAQGDRSMSPAEMRSALNFMRRAYIQDAVRWARDIQGLAPVEGAFADVDAGFRGRSQSILDQYGEEERSYHQGVDPFNLGPGPGNR